MQTRLTIGIKFTFEELRITGLKLEMISIICFFDVSFCEKVGIQTKKNKMPNRKYLIFIN